MTDFNYTPPDKLKLMLGEIERLRSRRVPTRNFFDALNNRDDDREVNSRIAQLQQAIQGNQGLQSGEMNSLIQSVRQGGLQGPGNPSLQFQHPAVQQAQFEQIQNQQKHQQAMQVQGLRNMGSNNQARTRFDNPGFFLDPTTNQVVAIGQTNDAGGPMSIQDPSGRRLEAAPEGSIFVPSASMANLNAGVIGTRGGAETEVERERNALLAEDERIRELDASRVSAWARTSQKDDQTEMLTGLIGDAEEMANFWETGMLGGIAGRFWGTNAYDLRAKLDIIKANIGFDRLQEMRENSPTGGALGNVSELENRLLQAVWGNLEASQSEGAFKENLRLVQQQVNESWDRVLKVYEETYGEAYFSGEDSEGLGLSEFTQNILNDNND